MADPLLGETLVEADALQRRVRELGTEVSRDYRGRDLLLVCVLKGAVFFASDSGLTLQYMLRSLGARNPATVEVCALLTKPDRRKVDLPVKYVGFEIADCFAICYGLDHAERYRNLPYVAALAGS